MYAGAQFFSTAAPIASSEAIEAASNVEVRTDGAADGRPLLSESRNLHAAVPRADCSADGAMGVLRLGWRQVEVTGRLFLLFRREASPRCWQLGPGGCTVLLNANSSANGLGPANHIHHYTHASYLSRTKYFLPPTHVLAFAEAVSERD